MEIGEGLSFWGGGFGGFGGGWGGGRGADRKWISKSKGVGCWWPPIMGRSRSIPPPLKVPNLTKYLTGITHHPCTKYSCLGVQWFRIQRLHRSLIIIITMMLQSK